ncbi:hypothetical protein HD554DRAFT_2002175, partial [Boletus coccyginus]
LLRAMHNSQRIGKLWLHIKNYEHRAKCPLCDAPIEDLEHILTLWPSPRRLTVWRAAQKAWPPSLPPRQQPTFGQILGSGEISPSPENDHRERRAHNQAYDCLLRILISESAHLIWVLRCERVRSDRSYSVAEIETRWVDKINIRL